MASHSLYTCAPLNNQDVETVSRILALEFKHYQKNNSPSYEDMLRELSIIAGIGYTANLEENSVRLSTYQGRLDMFINFRHWKNSNGSSIQLISSKFADMWECGINSCRSLGYPKYFDSHVEAFKRFLNRVVLHQHSEDLSKPIKHLHTLFRLYKY